MYEHISHRAESKAGYINNIERLRVYKVQSQRKEFEMIAMVILFAFLLCIGVILNIVLAVMTIKLKRVKEQEKQDVKRHLDVLYATNSAMDMIGSMLCYSALVYIYKREEIDEKTCVVFMTFATFYITTIAVLTSTINLHITYSCIKPLEFFVYLKTRMTRIPLICVSVSLFLGVISIVITACGHPRLSPFKSSTRLFSIGCQMDQRSPAMFYFAFLIYQALVISAFTLVTLLYASIKRRRKWHSNKAHSCGCAIFPKGVPFKMTFALVYFLSWAPCAVVMAIVMSRHNISHDVILSSCYALLIPSLLSPTVSFVIRKELRDMLKQHLSRLIGAMRTKQAVRGQGLTIRNEAAVTNKD